MLAPYIGENGTFKNKFTVADRPDCLAIPDLFKNQKVPQTAVLKHSDLVPKKTQRFKSYPGFSESCKP